MMDESSTMSEMSSATSSAWMSSETAATYTSSASYSQMTYGSGSSSWGGSGYDSCVQQCVASFGQPSATWAPSATETGSSSGSSGGSGVTHTIIVAPSQGVLRYIPFSTNASVGDTLEFMWGAGPHTVTRSSALEVCNKTSANPFSSGSQNESFVFNQVVNDTKPIWFYCGIPTHCQKGMFGGVNIGQADPTGSDSFGNSSSGSSDSSSSSGYMSMSQVMENMTMTGDMSAMWSYTKSKCAGNTYANNWGMSTNMAGMSSDAMMQTMENVMYMQTLIAANPSMVKNGSFAVSNAANMTVPLDLKQALAAASSNSTGAATSGSATSSATQSGVAGAAGAASSSAPSSTPSNGAGSIASSSIAVGLVAVVATFFAL
jgi:plastocyanin